MIATSSTCTFALRDEYPEVLNVDNKGLRDHIELATRWLWRKLDEGKTLPLKPLPLKVVYHTPCHMEKMGWTLYTLELLRKIPGLELTVLDSQCCGIAGTYGFKRELPHLTSHRCATVPPDRRERRGSGHHRLRNLQMAD